MDKLNAPPIVVRILCAILGILSLIGSLFIITYLPPALTLDYVMSWGLLLVGVGFLGVALKLPEMLSKWSPLPYVVIAGSIVVRLINGRASLFGGANQRANLIGLAIGLVVGAYLWIQVRRLQRAPVA